MQDALVGIFVMIETRDAAWKPSLYITLKKTKILVSVILFMDLLIKVDK